jgi:arabinose-5-phosphate isomerase
VVVSGLGKSGLVGHKIASTLASTGTPAFFLHAAEASHGDLGMVMRRRRAAGASPIPARRPRLLALLPPLRRLGVPVIAMTGQRAIHAGARGGRAHRCVSVAEEACPLNLAPTASTTAVLAMGDALATALLEARGFTSEDFARAHPGGSLGRKLLLHVSDVMRRGDDLPRVPVTATLEQGLLEMSRKGLGMTAVVNAAGGLAGVFTDGDLRRALDRGLDLRGGTLQSAMTRESPQHPAAMTLPPKR